MPLSLPLTKILALSYDLYLGRKRQAEWEASPEKHSDTAAAEWSSEEQSSVPFWTGKTELLLVAAAPYPIHAASPQWCSLLGVSEHDLKGCGFKVFDKDLIAHTQVLLFLHFYPPAHLAVDATNLAFCAQFLAIFKSICVRTKLSCS
jgi:hypothetical protein